MTLRREDKLGYADIICDFFCELKGSGLILSPGDLDIVSDWEKKKIPVEVVCRGLVLGRESHEKNRPNVPPPHNLSYYRQAVMKAWKAHRERVVGAGDSI